MKRIKGLFIFLLTLCSAFGETRGNLNQDEIPDSIRELVAGDRVIKDINECIMEKNWKGLVELYKDMLCPENTKLLKKLYPDVEIKDYSGFSNYLSVVLSTLPEDALKEFRFEFDGQVPSRKLGTWKDIEEPEQLVDLYPFASNSGKLMWELVNFHIEQGNIKRSLPYLKKMLYFDYPTITKQSVIARLAHCYSMLGRSDLIKELYKYKKLLDAKVLIKGEEQTLKKSLDKFITVKQIQSIPDSGKFELPTEYHHSTFPHAAEVTGSLKSDYTVIPVYHELNGKKRIFVQNGQQLFIMDENCNEITKPLGFPQKLGRQKAGGNLRTSRYGPFTTCQIMDNLILTNMYCSYLRVNLIMAPEGFGWTRRNPAPLNSIRAYHTKTFKLEFSTDDAIVNEKKKGKTAADFVQGDFSFSLPVVTKDDKIYAGLVAWNDSICDQTSYIVCFKKTNSKLELVWHTKLSSRGFPLTVTERPLSPTFILEQDGIVYACTNTGSVAAIDENSGKILWLNAYSKIGVGGGPVTSVFARPPSYPVIHKDYLYFLPMNEEEIVIIDTVNGTRLKPFDIKRKWDRISHLHGIMKGSSDHLILSGENTIVVKLDENPSKSSFVTSSLIKTATKSGKGFSEVTGHGTIIGDRILIPCIDITKGKDREIKKYVIRTLESKSWRQKEVISFPDDKTSQLVPGNLIFSNGKLLVAGDDLIISYE